MPLDPITQAEAHRLDTLLPTPLQPDYEPAFSDPGRDDRRAAEWNGRLITELYRHIARLEERIAALEAGAKKG